MSTYPIVLQHIKDPKSSVEYFVSGSGAYVVNNTDHKDAIPASSLRFYWANPYSYGGFATIQASSGSMSLTFIDAQGRRLYTRALHPRDWEQTVLSPGTSDGAELDVLLEYLVKNEEQNGSNLMTKICSIFTWVDGSLACLKYVCRFYGKLIP